MTPDQVFNLGINSIIALFFVTVIKSLLQYSLEKRRAEIKSEERLAEIEQYKFATDKELEKMKIIKEIANNNVVPFKASRK